MTVKEDRPAVLRRYETERLDVIRLCLEEKNVFSFFKRKTEDIKAPPGFHIKRGQGSTKPERRLTRTEGGPENDDNNYHHHRRWKGILPGAGWEHLAEVGAFTQRTGGRSTAYVGKLRTGFPGGLPDRRHAYAAMNPPISCWSMAWPHSQSIKAGYNEEYNPVLSPPTP